MSYSYKALAGDLPADLFLEAGDLSLGLGQVHVVAVKKHDARAVIAPVFQSFQTVDDYRISLPITDVASYSTHNI